MKDLDFKSLDAYLLQQNNKIIHQIWFGTIPNKRKARKAFEGLKKYRDSWLINNPSWAYACWNLKQCADLISQHYRQYKEMYDNYQYEIQKCDAVRYFILHRYGGLYADMDYYCNKPWDEVRFQYTNDFYLVETPNKMSNEVHVSNSLMYSRSGHNFWNKLFIELKIRQTVPSYYGRHITIMFTTGPGILNRVYKMYKWRYRLDYYPFELFHPYGLNSGIKLLNNKIKVYAIHIGKGSWEARDSKLLIFLYKEYSIVLFILLTLILPAIVK